MHYDSLESDEPFLEKTSDLEGGHQTSQGANGKKQDSKTNDENS